MRRKAYLGMGALVFAVLVGLALGVAAPAQTVTAIPAQGFSKAQAVQALKSAHNLLAVANRDYDGHRARAAQEVRKALKELGYHHKKAQPGAVSNAAKQAARSSQPAVHEFQASSDTQLQQAQQTLQGVLASMSGHAKAAANLRAAIAEINVALAIR